MEKSTNFGPIKFSLSTVREAHDHMLSLAGAANPPSGKFRVKIGKDRWDFDSFEEFAAEFNVAEDFVYRCSASKSYLHIDFTSTLGTSVTIEARTREEIQKIAVIFETRLPEAIVLPDPYARQAETIDDEPKIFIGHGRSPLWEELKNHLRDKHEYEVMAYEVGQRAGHTIRDILDEMMEKSSIAFLVLTGEDELPNGNWNPRANVIHETGLFQGRLGFARAIVLLEDGTQEFSNLAGIQQIRFPKGRIKETFGDVLATIKREFPTTN